MNYHILTIFPNMFTSYFDESIIAAAVKNKLIKINIYDIRKNSKDKNKKVDDKAYGGGPGMIMQVDPIVNTIEKVRTNIENNYQKELVKYESNKLNKKTKTKKPAKPKILFVHFSPSAEKLNTSIAKEISKKYNHIIFICGRYEGIDERVYDIYGGLKISIGDYVLTGGELPAMICVDTISRQIVGVLGKYESLEENRISSSKVYTRPEIFNYEIKNKKIAQKEKGKNKQGKDKINKVKKIKIKKYIVPKVLLSGNHKEIEKWKLENK